LTLFHHRVGRGLVSIVVLALASAASYGIAAVLQHREAVKAVPSQAGSSGLVARLVRQPIWLHGSAFDVLGYLFQFLALRRGSLALVEPLLVLSLVFALLAGAWLEHRPVSRSEMGAASVTSAGLAIFLVIARPGIGAPNASSADWAGLSALIAGMCGLLALAARRGTPQRAALLYSAGSGIAFGYVAAVTERTGHILNGGALHTLATWPPYALVAGAVVALVLTQSAFHAGILRLSLPTLTIAQPLVALAIGLGFFGERVDSRWPAVTLEIVGVAMMTVGVYALARSPVITAPKETGPKETPG
jgi:drug/metabolite transporter (DMT)-like permease